MKVSLSWLRQYLPELPEADRLDPVLTRLGLTVEARSTHGLAPVENVVVGEVLEIAQHPQADRLSVCKVRVSLDGDPSQIVCGAKNFKVGDRVPVALPGAELPGGIKITRAKLRGVESGGMMCSARELGLGDDHAGLLILPGRPEVGRAINLHFPPQDSVFELEVTPNRPDCLSHLGVAREIGAALGKPVAYPEVRLGEAGVAGGHDPLPGGVRVEWPDHCPHYRAYKVRGVKVGPSPAWLQERLQSVGLRPINNVVDVTNFVLLELGQPLHAFDARKIAGGTIVVRAARAGEKLVTLDGKERELSPRMAVIADAEKALVVAGVMGGQDAEVDATTTDLVLEAAWFNPAQTRWTSRRLGLSTDSSYRFERGVDPLGTEYAALRALALILEVAGGEWVGAPVVVGNPPAVRREIQLSGDFVRRRLGFAIGDDAIVRHLESLGLETDPVTDAAGEPVWDVGIPSWRADLERPIDLVEEVIRLHGCDAIPEAPVVVPGLLAQDHPVDRFVRSAAAFLAARGGQECIHYTLRSQAEIERWYRYADAAALRLDNPLTSDQTHLRTSVLPGLLDAVKLNLNRGVHPGFLFETGRVFREQRGQVFELVSVGFTLLRSPQPRRWRERQAPDLPQAQDLVRRLLELAGVDTAGVVFRASERAEVWAAGHGSAAGDVFKDGWSVRAGLFNPVALKAWDLDAEVIAGAIYLMPTFLERARQRPAFKALATFPAAARDLALVVPAGDAAEDVRRAVAKHVRTALAGAFAAESIEVFDVYQGKGLPDGTKSLAFALGFRAADRTLTDDEVNAVMARVQEAIAKDGRYRLR